MRRIAGWSDKHILEGSPIPSIEQTRADPISKLAAAVEKLADALLRQR